MPKPRIRVLIVDDSALVRSVLSRGLGAEADIEIVGTAADPYAARDLLVKTRPDVMTLDVEMPKMDGITFLRKVMATLPTPTIIVSSLTTTGSARTLEALAAGAVDVVAKPISGVADGLAKMMAALVTRVRAAAGARVVALAPEPAEQDKPLPERPEIRISTDAVIALGASTGGVSALGRILPLFPAWSPGIVIVQHMPAGFTDAFARRLDGLCPMRVSEAKHGDRVLNGHILVAPGGSQHLEVRRTGGEYRVFLVDGDPVSGHAPSVDVLFGSLARHAGPNAAACLLTGMGSDGASGLLALRLAGGRAFAQDKESSAVWGMPGAAEGLGASERLLPLNEVPTALVDAIRARKSS